MWRGGALLQLIVAGWLLQEYWLRAPLEVTHGLSTLNFSLPWWGFPTDTGWSSRYAVSLLFGVDGSTLWMGLAMSLVGLILSLWPGWTFSQPRFQLPALLILQGFALWTIFSYDLLVFYVGFEAVLIPMYYLLLMLGPHGEEGRRTAVEFLLYTVLGSLPMLVAILYGASEIGRIYSIPFTTSLYDWLKYPLPPQVQGAIYGAFALAFWVKLGLFPLHGWVLRLYRNIPLAGVVLSSALLTKLGGIGWLRIVPALPHGHFTLAPYVGSFAVISLLGAGLAAYFQKGLRLWLAYGTISHLSMVAIGIAATNPAGASGAAWFMVNHTILSAIHLLVVAALIERTGSEEIASLGGLAASMPQLTALWLLVSLASVGLPGLSQFPAEFLVLTGTYTSYALRRIVFIGALLGVVVSAVYTLPVLRRVLFGPAQKAYADLPKEEVFPLWLLGVWVIGAGFIAAPFLSEIQRTTTPLMQAVLFQVLGVR